MKHLPQLPSVLAMYCFCMIQIRSSGFPQPLAHPPDGLDIVELKLTYCLNKWAMLSNQPKDNHDIHKRFPPVHSLMHLAAKLASRKMKRFPQHRDSGPAAVDLNKKDPTATLGQPFFLFRPRNGRNTEVQDQQSVQGSNGKGKLDPRRLCSDYFEQMSSFFL
ncbi:neuromedin-S isoform X5 [Heterocephalus glaber]|uniref:Neuromedin-S n=1 Tax=Heterocephalus glaber TaxID=10181 RepID=A0AAX6SVA1_HETGA|nr:neuromedin-S isoform X5 [Heterocephalus glaber]